MTLKPVSSLESARKKFLMNSTYIRESNLFGSGGLNDSNTAQFARIGKNVQKAGKRFFRRPK